MRLGTWKFRVFNPNNPLTELAKDIEFLQRYDCIVYKIGDIKTEVKDNLSIVNSEIYFRRPEKTKK